MKLRVLQLLIVTAFALPMMSCPAGPSGPVAVSLGLWLFTISETGFPDEYAALRLLAGGQTEKPSPRPPQADSDFSGTLTWMQGGSNFVLDQVVSVNNEHQYTGTVHTSTSMSGAWMRTAGGIDSGTWSAVKLP